MTHWDVCRKKCFSSLGCQSHPPFPWLCYCGNDLISIVKECDPPLECPYLKEHEAVGMIYSGARIATDITVSQESPL
jgi:hypothetical protein